MKKLAIILTVLALLTSMLLVPAAAEEPVLQNYCKDATATATAGEGADKIVDGMTDTAWTAGAESTVTVTIDLGKIVPIGYIEILWKNAPAAYNIYTRSAGDQDVEFSKTIENTEDRTEDKISFDVQTGRIIYIELVTPIGSEYGIAEVIARKTADAVDTSGEASYPSSGAEIPEGSVLLNGEKIGDIAGYGGNIDSGSDAAFDGDINTFFDPNGGGESSYCGIDAGGTYIVTKLLIHPRDGHTERFRGATIEASNDKWFDESVVLFHSIAPAEEWEWQDCTDDIIAENNTGYRYFRYLNDDEWGDVAEIEIYGYAAEPNQPEETDPAPDTAVVTEEPDTNAPETDPADPNGAETNAPETKAPETQPADDAQKSGLSPIVIAAIAAAAAVVIAVIVIVILKKKKA